MRLENMTTAHVRRAIQIYLEIAWPGTAFPRPRLSEKDFEGIDSLEELFKRFDKPRAGESGSLKRYMLRLGNARYPFMKFVVQEYLVDAEYFFSVDTHDDLDVRPDNPDYDAWQELKRHNLNLKLEIEAAWAREGLPTNADLLLIAEGIAAVEKENEKRARLLVADDETDVCRGLAALLRGRGYVVETVYDGRQVIDRLQLDPVPDLLILDFAMPEFDGEEVLARIRADPRLVDLPVLLATASSIDLKRVRRASGFLRKPYAREVLFAMLSQLLERRPPKSGS
ncbi:MAG: response regulator [Planctomycetes bacterium]|nr:response regulator [Planctomycetota bacterium]